MRRFLLILLVVWSGVAPRLFADVPVDHAARIEKHLVAPGDARPIPPGQASIADRLAFWHVPGVGIAVIDGGKVVWAKGFGVADLATGSAVDEHTLFHGASLSKTLTAIAVLKFVQDGKIDLDQDINEQLIGWKLPPSEFTKDKKITPRRLMSHTAGMSLMAFGIGYSTTQPSTLIDLLNGKPPATQPVRVEELPGKRFHYSGGAIAIAQLLLEEKSGQPYPQLIQRDLFTPLGMSESTFEQSLTAEQFRHVAPGFRAGNTRVNGPERVYPAMSAAGLWTTPSDYCNVIVEIQRAASGAPAKILSPGAVAAMLTPYIANAKSPIARTSTVGLGVFLAGQGKGRTFFHAGSHPGYSCYMVGRLEAGQGVVVMTNGDNAFGLIGEIVQTVANEYGWQDFQFIPPPKPKPATQPVR